jgi:hypothetical protein
MVFYYIEGGFNWKDAEWLLGSNRVVRRHWRLALSESVARQAYWN